MPILSFLFIFLTTVRPPPTPTLFPYTTLFRSMRQILEERGFAVDQIRFFASARSAGKVLPFAGRDVVVEDADTRSEEHTSELQSHVNLVCRLLLEKKKCTFYGHHTEPVQPGSG